MICFGACYDIIVYMIEKGNKMAKNLLKHIQATEYPLSADIVIYTAEEGTWIYDVGCSDESYEKIIELSRKNIIISHFHPDHMGNLERLSYENLYVGKNTYKYTKRGIVVEEPMEPDQDIRIIPMPSSHAKGCLAMQIGNEYLLVGDAFYPQHKGDKRVYNVQHLRAQIEILKNIDVKWIGVSHQEEFWQDKEKVLGQLAELFERREKNKPFIYI